MADKLSKKNLLYIVIIIQVIILMYVVNIYNNNEEMCCEGFGGVVAPGSGSRSNVVVDFNKDRSTMNQVEGDFYRRYMK